MSESETPPDPKDQAVEPIDWKERFDAKWKSSRVLVGIVVLAGLIIAFPSLRDGIKGIVEIVHPSHGPEPKFVIEGRLSLLNVPAMPPGIITVKVFWIDPAAKERTSLIQSPELSQVETSKGSLTYKLTFFDDPPPSAIYTAESSSHAITAQMAVGRLGVFIDAGSDGFYNGGKDTLIAANIDVMVLWRRIRLMPELLAPEDKRLLADIRKVPLGFCLAVDRWEMAEYAGMECTDRNKAHVDFTVSEDDITSLNRKLQDELSRTRKAPPGLGKSIPKATR